MVVFSVSRKEWLKREEKYDLKVENADGILGDLVRIPFLLTLQKLTESKNVEIYAAFIACFLKRLCCT